MKSIRQSVIFNASPHEIYEMLMDSKKHSEFTGAKASISREVGGKFSTWDGYSTGITLKLVQDKKIVQKWRASDWPNGHYSTIIVELKKVGGKTRLAFTQTDVPEDQYESVKDGWIEFYWNKMKEALK